MIRNICLIDTPYALSIYLLKMSMEEIENTLFFVGEAVNKHITMQLPHYVFVKNQSVKDDWMYKSWLRLYKYIKCWTYPFKHIYAQDHLYIASQIIGPYEYVNISDGPGCYTIWELGNYKPQKPKPQTWKSYIKSFFANGKMQGLVYGSNSQCACRWITSLRDSESIYIKGKNYEYVDAALLWQTATEDKIQFLKRIYNISDELLHKKIDTLILTQPFREDCGLTDQEMRDIYSPYIVGRENVAIKIHPRDKFDWKTNFPAAYIVDTYAPMQLLNYIGFYPQEAVTVSSTSICEMTDKVHKIRLGTTIHPKILKTYGDY